MQASINGMFVMNKKVESNKSKTIHICMSPGQYRRLNELALHYGESKSAIVHRSLDIMYFSSGADNAAHLISYLKSLKEKK